MNLDQSIQEKIRKIIDFRRTMEYDAEEAESKLIALFEEHSKECDCYTRTGIHYNSCPKYKEERCTCKDYLNSKGYSPDKCAANGYHPASKTCELCEPDGGTWKDPCCKAHGEPCWDCGNRGEHDKTCTDYEEEPKLPSVRIDEIYQELSDTNNYISSGEIEMDAIKQYLNEQHEADK